MSIKKNILKNQSRIDTLFIMVVKLWEDVRGVMTDEQLEQIKKEAQDWRCDLNAEELRQNEEDYTEEDWAKDQADPKD